MYILKESDHKLPVYIWAKENEIEKNAIQQIKNASNLPFAFHHAVLCPDAHTGVGCPVGGVLATQHAIVVNFVGVDIGCGMSALCTGYDYTEFNIDKLKSILGEIRKRIPVGFNRHNKEQKEFYEFESISIDHDIYPCIFYSQIETSAKSIGTLGGGNHFIELQKDDKGILWIMIHSGSRNLGKQVCDYYNKKAKELNIKYFSNVPKEYDLAFIPDTDELYQKYCDEMTYCVDFAFANRKLMMSRIIEIFNGYVNTPLPEQYINIAHNYARMENHFGHNVLVHRKGATSARLKEVGIIPSSMGSKSYIVEGLGNPESFMSCSHGAGRLMSRTKAKSELNLQEQIDKMDVQGIIHGMRNKDNLDEAPDAYKNIDQVMANQADLVKILVELTPLAVIKG